MSGSSLFTKQHAVKPHLLQGGNGVAGEVADLRRDLLEEFAPMAAITVEEFTNPAADAAAGLHAATATSVAVQTLLAAALIAGGKTALAAFPRNVTFTTAGVTPADAPATATIVGTDIHDNAQTETVALAQTATIALGVKAFKTITSITYSAGDGAAATIAVGFGSVFGLSKNPKSRAGLAAIIREVAIGALVTTGVLDATNKTYAPAAAANGTNDYAVYYEYDPTV